MKVMTILGSRPEIIRLSRIIPLLDRECSHLLVHTGQNFTPELSDIFFHELGLRKPDRHFDLGGGKNRLGRTVGLMFEGIETLIQEQKPDKVLILGDTNSGLCAFMAKRMGVFVCHMEAGNRSYCDQTPEEVNRRVIDQCSDLLMPYTENSRKNLAREGFPPERIAVTGNPIFEVMAHFRPEIEQSRVLDRLRLEPKRFALATLHRAENVDHPGRLAKALESLSRVQARLGLPLVLSLHPRTRDRMAACGLTPDTPGMIFSPPFGFFDFVRMEQDALCVLSDSGTVQEECSILKTPCLTLRDQTERPETLACGANELCGVEPERVLPALDRALARTPDWNAPEGYLVPDVSRIAALLVLT